jgi:hypothetical protein
MPRLGPKPTDVLYCKVCGDAVPAVFEHQHHEIPQAAGGSDGPLASLCAGCHATLHRVADMLMSKRAGLADDAAKIAYPDPAVRERLFDLANMVVEYMTLKRDGQVESDQPIKVMIELPREVKFAAQILANDHKGPTGRRLGLAPFITALVKQEVYRRYPHLKPKI